MQELDVDYTKNKDKFVEYKIPKLIFEMLLFGDPKLTKHQFLYGLAQQDQTAICHIDDGLGQKIIETIMKKGIGYNKWEKKEWGNKCIEAGKGRGTHLFDGVLKICNWLSSL